LAAPNASSAKTILSSYPRFPRSCSPIKNWGSKKSQKYVDFASSKKVRKAAEPFLEWLNTAESDEESGEEE